MKIRYILFLLVFILLSAVSMTPLYACELAITPEQSEVIQNEKLELTAYRRQIHKRCIINMDEIKIETINCTIDQQTSWTRDGNTWSKKVTVTFPNIGEVYVKLVYDCEKHPGDIVPFTAKINVLESVKKEPPKRGASPTARSSPSTTNA